MIGTGPFLIIRSLVAGLLCVAAASTLGSLGHAAQTLGDLVMREIPAVWIYGGVGFAALLYAALFGLGAAFRTLVLAPQHAPY